MTYCDKSVLAPYCENKGCKRCSEMKSKLCGKCGEQYETYRDGYCPDCEADDDTKSLEERFNQII